MAIITLLRRDENHDTTIETIDFDGPAYEWIVENVKNGENFAVYEGDVCDENEISRSERIEFATDVTIVMLPAGEFIIPFIISIIVATAVTQLIPTPEAQQNLNRAQESPNNQLSDRRNRVRTGQRIPDICGEVRSVPDVITSEYARYLDGVEERIGAYCVGRWQISVEDVKDGDDLIDSTSKTQGVNVFYPFTSPNKGNLPAQTFGIPISNEPIYGVYTDKNAVGQTLAAPKYETFLISTEGNEFVGVDRLRGIGYVIDPGVDFASKYVIGSKIKFYGLWTGYGLSGAIQYVVLNSRSGSLSVTSTSTGRLEFSIDGAPEWLLLPNDNVNYLILSETIINGVITERYPVIESIEKFVGDIYRITSTKVDKLLFNVFASNGIYRRNNNGDYDGTTVEFQVFYYRLDDSFNRIGQIQNKELSISGNTFSDIGVTLEIDLDVPQYVEWYIIRTTIDDEAFPGTIVDSIKLKSAFGLYSVGAIDFGNVTILQTRRRGLPDSSGVSSPELNCRATEMITKYIGNGSFEPFRSKNTQAMQSLIAKAIDPRIGRLAMSEIDADLFLQIQNEIETYFGDAKAGRCCYTLDSTSISAQDTLYLIANCVNSIIWREGRLLTGFFESPQTFPQMMFTHRSKQPNSETWSRTFDSEYNGVEFKYSDEASGQQEVLTFPQGANNPKSFEIPGIKGVELATWRMMREYNKLKYQRETVDVTVTPEGRFVRPSKLISIVKGTRVGSYDGEVRNANLLTVELSQAVKFTAGDDHYIQFKKRNGGVDVVSCRESILGDRFVELDFAPTEPLYFGNNAKKTEFSFANEGRAESQLVLPQEIDSSDKYYTSLKCVNYDNRFYQDDPINPVGRAFSDGFSNGFS